MTDSSRLLADSLDLIIASCILETISLLIHDLLDCSLTTSGFLEGA
jgi:hypothetical protein